MILREIGINSSIIKFTTITTQLLYSDLSLSRVSKAVLTHPFILSPLGLVPKTDQGWQRIHHLSFPPGDSVNDWIPQHFATLEYTSRQELLRLVLRAGPNATLIKKDLKDAFRVVPIAPLQCWLLGFKWQGHYYHENCLPFGLRTAPFIFNLFAEGLH